MAERRMFAKTITESDAFLDMPLSAQALYLHLAMNADDDGFLNAPKKIQRMIGASEDDLKLLIAKRFVLAFDTGIVVIKHWRMHNTLRKDRYNPTQYQKEFMSLTLKDNGSYTENSNSLATTWQPLGNQLATQVRLGKDRLGKYNDDLSINDYLKETERKSLESSCGDPDSFRRLIRYADEKIRMRSEDEYISDPYQYLLAIGVNGGFIKG